MFASTQTGSIYTTTESLSSTTTTNHSEQVIDSLVPEGNKHIPLTRSGQHLNLPVPENGELLSDQPVSSSTASRKPARNYSLGDTELFWVQDMAKAEDGFDNDGDNVTYQEGDLDEAFYEVNATLINSSKYGLFFFETNDVDSATYRNLAILADNFDNNMALKDNQLGHPSDIDHNGKTIILIYRIRGPTSFRGIVAGFFWSLHQYKKSDDPTNLTYYSEEKEIININMEMYFRGVLTDAAPTLVHEYFHLIHFSADPDEHAWIDEGIAVFTEYWSGFKSGLMVYLQNSQNIGIFQNLPDSSLTYFESGLKSYGMAFLFVLYLYQRYGVELIHDIVQSKLQGIESIREQINANNYSLSFEDFYSDWVITNYMNDATNKPYTFDGFTDKAETSSYNRHTLRFIPDELLSEKITAWSSIFYTLPKNDNKSYKINFLPEILAHNTTEYTLSLITDYKNGTWNVERVNLFNNTSGSVNVKFQGSEVKYLILASMTGGEADYYVDADAIPSTRFNFFIQAADTLDSKFVFDTSKEFDYEFTFQLLQADGSVLTNKTANNFEVTVWEWSNETRKQVTASTALVFNDATKSWTVSVNPRNLTTWQTYYLTINYTSNSVQGQVFTPSFIAGELPPEPVITTTTTTESPSAGFTSDFLLLIFGALVVFNLTKRKRK